MAGESGGEMSVFLRHELAKANRNNPDSFLFCKDMFNYQCSVFRSAGND